MVFTFLLKKMTNPNEPFIREFIEVYKSLPCLWRIKSTEYSNRNLKKDAYAQLVAVFDRHHPSVKGNEDIVRKKLQALRTVFRKELNKVDESKRSGAGTGDVYVPRLWYFDLLSFTRDQELPRPSTSKMSLQEEDLVENSTKPLVEDQSQAPSQESLSEAGPSEPENTLNLEVEQDEAGPSTVPMHLHATRKRKPQITTAITELIGLAYTIMEKHNCPPISGLAHFMDDELNAMALTQRNHAQHIIIDVLRAGRADLLNSSSCFSVGEPDVVPSGSQPAITPPSTHVPIPEPIHTRLRCGKTIRKARGRGCRQQVSVTSPNSPESPNV
ncbi:uncharacterized protein LOC142308621 [Anomaloglossus baeobatrachus]|uniref:uncharacterized protein LOC142308621 n=1 Tax=Anomaloglossus baeobatrachus TaxID=238106 RepID=UPI003F50475B